MTEKYMRFFYSTCELDYLQDMLQLPNINCGRTIVRYGIDVEPYAYLLKVDPADAAYADKFVDLFATGDDE